MMKELFSKNNLKILLISIYLLILSLFLVLIYFSEYKELFIINNFFENQSYYDEIKKQNFISILITFFFFTFFWSFFLGFGLFPILISAYLFDIHIALFLVVFSKTIGSALLYSIIKKIYKQRVVNFLKNFNSKLFFIISNLKTYELSTLFILRFLPIPVQLADLGPVLIDAKIRNFIIAKFFGSLVSHFLILQILYSWLNAYKVSGKVISFELLKSPELIYSSLFFILFICLTNIVKYILIKKSKQSK